MSGSAVHLECKEEHVRTFCCPHPAPSIAQFFLSGNPKARVHRCACCTWCCGCWYLFLASQPQPWGIASLSITDYCLILWRYCSAVVMESSSYRHTYPPLWKEDPLGFMLNAKEHPKISPENRPWLTTCIPAQPGTVPCCHDAQRFLVGGLLNLVVVPLSSFCTVAARWQKNLWFALEIGDGKLWDEWSPLIIIDPQSFIKKFRVKFRYLWSKRLLHSAAWPNVYEYCLWCSRHCILYFTWWLIKEP